LANAGQAAAAAASKRAKKSVGCPMLASPSMRFLPDLVLVRATAWILLLPRAGGWKTGATCVMWD
jgi:hypothetical protein